MGVFWFFGCSRNYSHFTQVFLPVKSSVLPSSCKLYLAVSSNLAACK